MLSQVWGTIGIFDSGYGGLTILEKIKTLLPQYDYLYLGDNAMARVHLKWYINLLDNQ